MKPKVFGVGAHRTGTTSLMRALRVLGYRTSHWKDRHEINADLERGRYRLSLMERVDAVSDLPIPSIFRELDAAFPDARFILTIRHPDEWLASVERHARGRILEHEEQAFYGRSRFDAEAFRSRFEAHNREVVEHFAGRSDLLVVNIPAGDGWDRLCAFLGEELPDPLPEFPHRSKGHDPAATEAS